MEQNTSSKAVSVMASVGCIGLVLMAVVVVVVL